MLICRLCDYSCMFTDQCNHCLIRLQLGSRWTQYFHFVLSLPSNRLVWWKPEAEAESSQLCLNKQLMDPRQLLTGQEGDWTTAHEGLSLFNHTNVYLKPKAAQTWSQSKLDGASTGVAQTTELAKELDIRFLSYDCTNVDTIVQVFRSFT